MQDEIHTRASRMTGYGITDVTIHEPEALPLRGRDGCLDLVEVAAMARGKVIYSRDRLLCFE